jgi:hypothetical protein
MMDDLLLWLRVAAHLITFAAVAFWYRDPLASFRPCVSMLATVIAGASLAAAVTLSLSITPAGIFDTLLFVAFCVLVLRAGGNVARLLPRRVWSHRP